MTSTPQQAAIDAPKGLASSLTPSAKPSRLMFAGLSIGNFLVLLDTSILNIALPDIRRDLGATATSLPWAAVAYAITFAGLLLAAGAVSDRFGARRVYACALVAFAALSLGCAAAPTISVLIGGRVLLGVAAACMVPSSIGLLAGLFAEPGARARAIGVWAAVTSSGLLLGPLLGGLLVVAGGWRLVFLVNPPIALLALGLSRRRENPRPPTVRPLDLPGIGLSIVTLVALTYGLIDGGTNGWSRPGPLIGIGVAVVAGVVLILVERRVAHPVLPPTLVARRDLSGSIIAAAVATLVFYGMLYTLTLWLQQARELTPLETGLSFVPMTLPMCVLPIYTGRLVAALGARRVIVAGLMFDVLAGGLLLGASTDGSIGWVLAAELALVLASTTVIPAATASVAINAPAEVSGAAQGALNAGRQAGSALGVAILGPIALLPHIGLLVVVVSVVAVVVMASARPPTAAPSSSS